MKKMGRGYRWGLTAIVGAGAIALGLGGCGSSSTSGSGGGTTTSTGSGAASCTDALMNGAETDVDCGGASCPGCALGKACGGDQDCAAGACIGKVCTEPPATCMDGMKGNGETDVDCGGGACPGCADGKACVAGSDCQSKSCVGQVCKAPVVGLVWAKRFGGMFDQTCYVVRTDAADNVVMASWIQGIVDFGKGGIGSGEQIALVKVDADGATQWSKTYPTGSKQYPYGLGVSGEGSITLAGGYQHKLQFGAPAPDLNPVGVDDFYAAGFSGAGATLWAKSFGDISQFQQFNGVAIAADGNPVMTGWLNGSANFGGGALNGNNVDVVVVKLDKSTGGHIWSHAYGDGKLQGGFSVAIDGAGDVVVSGYLDGSVDFGGGAIGGGGNNVFVLKLSAAGQYLWAKAFPSTATELRPNRIALDKDGNIFLAGGSIGTIDFGGGPLQHQNGIGVYDAFLAKLDPDGKHLWSKSFGDSDEQWIDSVAVDKDGNVIVLGSFLGSMDLGGGKLVSQGGNEFGGDVFLAKFSGAGTWLFNQRYGDGAHQMAQSMTVDSSGAVILCGELKGSIDFGGGALTSEGGTDIFLAKINLP